MNTEALLAERQTTHGNFADNAFYGQALRDFFRSCPHWNKMRAEHREAFDYFAGKMSRILSGQSGFAGHWEDIRGYARLAEEACEK